MSVLAIILIVVGAVAVLLALRLGTSVVLGLIRAIFWIAGRALSFIVRIPFWIYDAARWLVVNARYRYGRFGVARYHRATRKPPSRRL